MSEGMGRRVLEGIANKTMWLLMLFLLIGKA